MIIPIVVHIMQQAHIQANFHENRYLLICTVFTVLILLTIVTEINKTTFCCYYFVELLLFFYYNERTFYRGLL